MLVELVGVEPWIWRAAYKVIHRFSAKWRFGAPNPKGQLHLLLAEKVILRIILIIVFCLTTWIAVSFRDRNL